MGNITKVYMLSADMDKDYSHTLYFESEAEQREYFEQLTRFEYTDFSYQRKDGILRIPEHVDKLLYDGCNYVMYQNEAYPNKWFYAFIESMEYINDGRTDVKIRTDCIQTWMFDVEVCSSFVEREHAASDQLGEHTYPEGLELGEYIANLHEKAGYGGSLGFEGKNAYIVLGVTKKPDGENVEGMLMNGIYSGVRYYAFDNSDAVNEFLSEYDSDGIGEAVQCMFMAPETLVVKQSDGYIAGTNLIDSEYINYSGEEELGERNKLLALATYTLQGYVPRNTKLLSFPYRYLLVANNAGASVPFKYEMFYRIDDGIKTLLPPEFIIEGVLTPGCSVRMVPMHYNGIERNDEEGINLGKYPIVNWTSDVYTNWLTQNGVNIAINVVSGVGQIVAGAAITAGTGGLGAVLGGGTVVGGVSQIANTLAQIHQQSFSAPQAKGNLNAGDVVTASNQNDFHFYEMTIRAEYAKIIDGYFDMYGYKCNRVKVPEKAHRAIYWYTKTIDANISGSIPQEDLQTIKDCYNRGITFWRGTHAGAMKDYKYAAYNTITQ